MTHLDDLAAALVDAELSHEARDRAFAHLAGCPPCRAEVEAQRRLKALLGGCAAPAPEPDLLVRLLAVPGQGRVDPVRRAVPAAGPARPTGGRPAAGPGGARPSARPGRPAHPVRPARRRRRAAVGSVSAVAVAVGMAVLLGGGETARPVRPPVSTFVRDHTATTDRLPLGDPGSGLVLTSFAR